MKPQPIVSFKNVSMRFPGVLANDDVSLDIYPGEIFALVGENGAGKSTLMNILYGLHEPNGGNVCVAGETIKRFAPSEALSRGVGMVHQHFKLVPSFTVTQNITLGCEPKRGGVFTDEKMALHNVGQLVQDYGLAANPRARVEQLSVGQQQRVEILKVLYRGAKVLILDEPTAVLTPQETDELFAVIRSIAAQKNMTVIIITHKLYEVLAISDRVGVMRRGKLVGTYLTCDVDEAQLASAMVGRNVVFEGLDKQANTGGIALSVSHVSVLNNRRLEALRDVSFDLHAGEIVGVAGVEGNGQSELVEAIAALRPITQGEIRLFGEQIDKKSPGSIRALGLAHVPEDRLATGLNPFGSLAENLLLGKQKRREFSVIHIHQKRAAIQDYAQTLMGEFDIRAISPDDKVSSLSGGNMQKAVVAREFSFDAKVLLIAQPTRGVDIGAITFIHQLIIEKRNQGCAILLVSADLDEIFRLSDRIFTMYEGQFTGKFDAKSTTKEHISPYLLGANAYQEARGREADQ